MLCLYTQGQPDTEKFAPYFSMVNQMFSFLGFKTLEPLVFGGLRGVNDAQEHPTYLKRMRDRAGELALFG